MFWEKWFRLVVVAVPQHLKKLKSVPHLVRLYSRRGAGAQIPTNKGSS